MKSWINGAYRSKAFTGPPLNNGLINATGNGSISCNIGVAQIKPTKINLSLFGRLDGEFGEVAVAACGAGVACCCCRRQRVATDALQQFGHICIGVLTQDVEQLDKVTNDLTRRQMRVGSHTTELDLEEVNQVVLGECGVQPK